MRSRERQAVLGCGCYFFLTRQSHGRSGVPGLPRRRLQLLHVHPSGTARAERGGHEPLRSVLAQHRVYEHWRVPLGARRGDGQLFPDRACGVRRGSGPPREVAPRAPDGPGRAPLRGAARDAGRRAGARGPGGGLAQPRPRHGGRAGRAGPHGPDVRGLSQRHLHVGRRRRSRSGRAHAWGPRQRPGRCAWGHRAILQHQSAEGPALGPSACGERGRRLADCPTSHRCKCHLRRCGGI
mmetsp:Transcript_78707/g.240861  ORF Transcript_78707/g.240861 Transcript_78707/m.240861 type:complete len:238 (+) Transcript_78707:201-914(+)